MGFNSGFKGLKFLYLLGSLHNLHIPQQYIRQLKSNSAILIFVQIWDVHILDSSQKLLQVYVFDWFSVEVKTSHIVYRISNWLYVIGVWEVNLSVPILTPKGGAVLSPNYISSRQIMICYLL